MARWIVGWGALASLALAFTACGSDGDGDQRCVSRAKGYTGSASECTVMADCNSQQRRLVCDAGGCECRVDDVAKKTLGFDPKYCAYSPDAGNGPNVEHALAACGWSY